MRRIASAASVLLALMLGAAPSGAGSESRQGRSSAIRTLDTFAVSAGPKGGVVKKSNIQLRRGRTYRLIASGAIRQSKTDATGRTVTYDLDPLYCFQTTDPAFGGNCSSAVPVYSPRLELALPPSTGPVTEFSFAVPGGSRLPYNGQHRYQAVFKAAASGPLYARVEPVPSVQEDSYSGAYKLEIQGEAPPKKKRKKKRRKRRVACPAPRSSIALARATASCQWYVDFIVRQRGDPFDSSPPPQVNLVDTETFAVGKVFFNAKPKRGRVAKGSAAGLIAHTDTSQSRTTFLDAEGGIEMHPARSAPARYTIGRGKITLEMSVEVTVVDGVEYLEERGFALRPDDVGAVRLVADIPLHQDDLFSLSLLCRTVRCGRTTFMHGHRYRSEPDNALRVRISLPHQL